MVHTIYRQVNITQEQAGQMQDRLQKLAKKKLKNHIPVGGFTKMNTPMTEGILKGLLSNSLGGSYIEIPGLIPGLNGSDGLMRSHWSNVKKAKKMYSLIIMSQKDRILQHKGKVSIMYTGFKSILMDWDNFCSSFKHIGDCLKYCKIIKDDKHGQYIL